jgi:hypothetical protein
MSEEKEIGSFEEFWDFYVGEHKEPWNRRLHFVGTTLAMGCIAGGLLTKRRWLLLAAPAFGYGFAWVGHFFVEKNKPASFKYPLWSLKADFVMWSKIATGKMNAEVERVLAKQRAAQAERGDEAAAAHPSAN